MARSILKPTKAHLLWKFAGMAACTLVLAWLALNTGTGRSYVASAARVVDSWVHGSPVDRTIPDGITVTRDIAFQQRGSGPLLLDLYKPDQASRPLPCVIVIRGAGWRSGDKQRDAFIAARLAGSELAAASIEYRSSYEATFPAARDDVFAAIAYLAENGLEHGIDGQRLALIGGSAGGHLALLVAALMNDPSFNPGSITVDAVVSMAGRTDFLDPQSRGREVVQTLMGTDPEEDKASWIDASPVHHVNLGDPPVLLIHSSTDDIVPVRHSTIILERYREFGGSAQLVTLDGAPHDFWEYEPWWQRVLPDIQRFLLDELDTAGH